MKVPYSVLIVFVCITNLFSQMQTNDIDWEPPFYKSFWESPSGEIHVALSVDMLDEMGTWIYYRVDTTGTRIDIFERDVVCKCHTIRESCHPVIHQTSPCELFFEIDDASCNIEPYWESPDGSFYSSESIIIDTFGYWYLHMDADCQTLVDSIEIGPCPPLSDYLCDSINIDAYGHGDWNASYVADGSGTLNLEFDAATVPDQIIVTINGNEVLNSGHYSSYHCTSSYANCNGTVVPGCQNNLIVDLPIEYLDTIDINVYGDVCGSGYTYWSLIAECSELSNRSQKPRSQINDEIESQIVYSPNPANEIIIVEFIGQAKPSKLSFTNAEGILVTELEVQESRQQLNIENFTSGVYIVRAHYSSYIDAQLITIIK